jgi:hypothetical protein
MHLQMFGGEEKGGNTRARLAGMGVAWRGKAIGAGA